MRRLFSLLLSGIFFAGCAWHHDQPPKYDFDANGTPVPQEPKVEKPNVEKAKPEKIKVEKPKGEKPKVIMTPQTTIVGKAVRVNSIGRFVVINFPIGGLPANGVTLDVFRQGMKVGEVKVTGPGQDDNTVGDITAGEVQEGDELRSR